MLPQTGERQVAENIEGIKPNHRQRYLFAINAMMHEFNGIDSERVIVDCACGVGYGTWMIANSFPNARVIGMDIHPPAIEAAQRAYQTDNNEFHVVDLSDVEKFKEVLEPFNVDAIVSIETIEHVIDDDTLLKMYAETAPFLVGSVPNQDIVPFHKEQHPFHFRHYTKKEFTDLLAANGYTPLMWATQYDKIPGEVYAADDGMGFIVSATQAAQ